MMKQTTRHLHLIETNRIPWDGLLLGWGAMVPFAILAAVIWLSDMAAEPTAEVAQVWGGALLLFFSGVRRGLSFRTEDGPTLRQLTIFAVLFFAGLIVLSAPISLGLAILAAAIAALAWEDIAAAQRGEVPLYFSRLRPAQMLFGLVSVILCWLAT